MGVETLVISHHIEVVLPTYNGAPYLKDQIRSIWNQSIRPTRLLVRDDNSTDTTLDILSSLQEHYGDWLYLLHSDRRLGAMESINQLLLASSAPYISLSDQDDFWMPDKLKNAMHAILELESKYGSDYPLLVYSDLYLTDSSLNPLNTTFSLHQNLNLSKSDFSSLVYTNVVTGCTVLFNRALLFKAIPVPREALMHDWWLALVASYFGRVSLLSCSDILYRQHSLNQVGARGFSITYVSSKLLAFLANPREGVNHRGLFRQLSAFTIRYKLSYFNIENLPSLSFPAKVLFLVRLPIAVLPSKQGFLRNLVFYIWLIFT